MTEDKKKYVISSTDRSRGRSTGVGPLVLKLPPFTSGQKGVPRPPVEDSGAGPGARTDPLGQDRRNFGVGMLAPAKSVFWRRYPVSQAV